MKTSLFILLYTMGEGDDVLSRYGHAALCVRKNDKEQGACYDYGHTDFSSPPTLIWDFMRKKGLYWGAVENEDRMINRYRNHNQSIYAQLLPLTEEQATTLAQRLEDSLLEEKKYYVYHHFYDNCSTRLRDAINEVSGGLLAQDTQNTDGPSYRDIAELGLSGFIPIQVALELGLGREADQHTSPWQQMLLPRELREQVRTHFKARPLNIYNRVGPPPPQTPNQGRWAVAISGGILGVLSMGIGFRKPRWAHGWVGVCLGLPALCFWSIAIITALTELRWNEALLLLWPTDLALPWLGTRYLVLRLIAVLGVGILWCLGIFIQPLGPVLLLVALPILALMGLRSLKPGSSN